MAAETADDWAPKPTSRAPFFTTLWSCVPECNVHQQISGQRVAGGDEEVIQLDRNTSADHSPTSPFKQPPQTSVIEDPSLVLSATETVHSRETGFTINQTNGSLIRHQTGKLQQPNRFQTCVIPPLGRDNQSITALEGQTHREAEPALPEEETMNDGRSKSPQVALTPTRCQHLLGALS